MKKRNKIICIILAIIFIAAIVVTGVKGLNVGIEYSEGVSIVFNLKKQYETKDIENIVKEIWPNEQFMVQKVEVYDESVLVKVWGTTDEQLENLANKINEKYELELKKEDMTLLYNSNEKLRNIIRPYVVPLIIATALIVVYYSVRFKDVKEIIRLLLALISIEGIIYSIYALTRLPINLLTMPIVMVAYVAIIIYMTVKNEKKETEAKN